MNLEPIIQSKVSQKVKVLVAQSCPTLCNPINCSPPARLLCPWNFPGKNTGVGGHSLLQEIFPTQASNSGLLHCRQILYPLIYKRLYLISCILLPSITPNKLIGLPPPGMSKARFEFYHPCARNLDPARHMVQFSSVQSLSRVRHFATP